MSESGYTGNEIAVVGMAGRFPGARTLAEFWRNLEQGVTSIRPLSDDVLREAGVPAHLLDDPNYVKAAAVLDDMEWWDAPFWGFTPLDASIMDPQHRLFLECAWEALEDGGHTPSAFPGAIGVFAGCGMQAYMSYNLLPNRKLMDDVGFFLVRHTGNDKDFIATRVSYQLDLRGPSVSVQTACSTSLVAMHMAGQSLLSGECDLALAGGVTIDLPHGIGYLYKDGEVLSPDGVCRAFDAASKGTVFGSGGGVVLLRRLDDALRDGDRIRTIIRGTAINNDGASKVGYMAPSVDGQAASIVEAMAIAGVTPDSISYVEAHGTGTPVGDPIELTALTQAFRTGTDKTEYCGIGSVKTNIGHLDTAAGIASFVKVALAMEHRKLPATLHYTSPNPAIDFPASPFYVNAALQDWQSNGPRRAGVSSLGVGGTNAHLIMEEAPTREPSGPSRPQQLLVLSAKTPSALDVMAANLADHLDAHPELPLADVAYTLARGREALRARRIVVAQDSVEARRLLDTSEKDRVFSDSASEQTEVAYLFAGGGAQHAGMGAELYESEPAYRAAVDEALSHLKPDHGREVRALLLTTDTDIAAASARLERPSLALPALFATQYAMARLLESWGIRASAMIGHSMGEYTAAHLAGVFTLTDAVRLVTLRGQLFEQVSEGAMLSVPLSEQALRAHLTPELSVAAVNAPELCVAAGPVVAIAALEARLAGEDVDARRLHIAVAAHSAMLEPILEEFGRFFRTITMQEPSVPFVSNESGTWITAEEATDPEYWVRHLRNTVRFADGIAELVENPDRALLEVGPGRVLATLAGLSPDRDPSQVILTSMRHPGDEGGDLVPALTALGRLWARGVQPTWTALWETEDRHRVGLPTYPWERQRHWIDAPTPQALAAPDDARRSRVADWFARPAWHQTPPPPAPVFTDDRVLLFAEPTPFGDALAGKLAAAGRRILRVEQGQAWAQDGTRFTVRPDEPEDYIQLLTLLAADGLPAQIVHAWGVTDVADAPSLDHMLTVGFHSLLELAQALSREDPDAALSVDVVTSNLQRLGGEDRLDPTKALLLGPARVIPREFPNVRSRAIDVVVPSAESSRDALAALVAAELCTPSTDETVAFRGRDRYIQQLESVALGSASTRLRTGGVYLITGGLGGIGFTLARHLATTHKARLVLVGRGATASRAKARVAELEALGSEVAVVQADITNVDQARRAVATAKERFGEIHGVFHAAGTLGDSLMPLKTREDAERVLAPKVQGTLALDAALGDTPLDLFVLFSSVSSIAGLAGQADYAAANAFLDAFAQERSARDGTFAIAVGWSAWRDVGMAANIASGAGAAGAPLEEVHPVLGRRIWASPEAELFASDLSTDTHWVLEEHRLAGGQALIPGSGFVELVRAALEARPESRPLEIQDVAFMSPFLIADGTPRELRVHLAQDGRGGQSVVIAGRTEDDTGSIGWQEHVTASARYVDDARPANGDLRAIAARCTEREERVAGSERNPHLAFGPRWNNLRVVRYGDGEAIAELELPAAYAADLEAYRLHPALLDMATACAEALVPGFEVDQDFYVPLSYTRLRMYDGLTSRLHSHVRLVPSDFDPKEIAVFDITIMDETGRVLVEIGEFMMTRIADPAQLSDGGGRTGRRRAHANFEPPAAPAELPPLVQGLDEAIRSDEGMQALELLLAGPSLPHVFATPKDIRPLLVELRRPQVRAARAKTPAAPTVPVHEIDAVLATHEAVHHCVVQQRVNRPGDLKLVAYVVFSPGAHATVSDLRRFLKARLPAHLVPSTFVDLDTLPLGADGAVDRAALPDPFGAEDDYVAPRSGTEILIADIWRDVLGMDRISVYDNFFDAGGHSLLAVRVVMRLDKALGVRLNQAVMVLQTLEQIAAECDKRRAGSENGESRSDEAPANDGNIGRRLFKALRGK